MLPAGRQRCPDLNERRGGLRRLDQHQDPVPRGGPERDAVRLRDVARHEAIRVDEMQQRPGHRRRNDRHHDHQRIRRRIQDVQLQAANRKDHDPGEPTGVHQGGENPGGPAADTAGLPGLSSGAGHVVGVRWKRSPPSRASRPNLTRHRGDAAGIVLRTWRRCARSPRALLRTPHAGPCPAPRPPAPPPGPAAPR